jgi:hypothetical protein
MPTTGSSGIYLESLFKSSIRHYAPEEIPNTSEDQPRWVQISEDGRWILYTDHLSRAAYLIRPNGSDKTEVPLPVGAMWAQFYRSSPKGIEIYYPLDCANTACNTFLEMGAVSVDLSGNIPAFGDTRKIVSLTNPGPAGITHYMMGEPSVVADHVFGQYNLIAGDKNTRHVFFLTIPDSGNGTANNAQLWNFSDTVLDSSMYGCGYTLSPDGAHALWNVGSQGLLKAYDPYVKADQYCVPNREGDKDHKGFVIAPFQRYDAPSMTKHGIVDTHAVSVNWVPEECRVGGSRDVDHPAWKYDKTGKYVIGWQTSYQNQQYCPFWGIFLCKWETNHWILLTPKDEKVRFPAVWIGDASEIQIGRSRHIRHIINGSAANISGEWFDLNGRKISLSAVQYSQSHRPGVYIHRTAEATGKKLIARQ